MRSILNLLTQIQELTLIRDEQRGLGAPSAEIAKLTGSINTLVDTLPQQVKANYQRLYARDHIVTASINNDSCTMCNTRLATALVQAVRLAREIKVCPNCARFLYDDSEGPKWIADRAKRTAAPKTGFARFSSPELMIADLKADTKEEAIAALARRMQDADFVDNAQKLCEAALAREAIVSTALGDGIAFPHVRGIEGGGLAMAFGISRKGIDFDGEVCNFIFFTTIPTAVSAFYLKLIATISQALRKPNWRAALLEATDDESLWKALSRATKSACK